MKMLQKVATIVYGFINLNKYHFFQKHCLSIEVCPNYYHATLWE